MIQIIENQSNRSNWNLIYYFWYSRFPLIILITSLVPYPPRRYPIEQSRSHDFFDFRYKCDQDVGDLVGDVVADVVDEVESIGDDIVDEMVDNMMNEIPTTEMITPTTMTPADDNEFGSYTYEDSNIELPDTIKEFMSDAAEKLGHDTSKEDWLSSLLNGPPTDDYAEESAEDQPETETASENENELTLVNMLT